ncbi:uncharacterized protein LOC100382658 [Zea mays]|uniref:Uncharacterized protein n=1 Tax=Zea mays TaxID=4577 RepID=C0P9L4_MAIZE|nr:uncharacterized protein LOC100382658 [Zea mays]ACN30859.1 unknown [Zea mays]|eukprot:NP_001168853.1 uncharacterized protein LOC100382658 [Zea mays]
MDVFNVTDREVTGFSTPNHPTSRRRCRWMTGTIWRHATRWASWHWRTTPPSISWAQTRACYSRLSAQLTRRWLLSVMPEHELVHVGPDTRLNYKVIELRTLSNQAIFQI